MDLDEVIVEIKKREDLIDKLGDSMSEKHKVTLDTIDSLYKMLKEVDRASYLS